MITSPNNGTPMYASATVTHDLVPSKLARDTIYMPSSVAARLLGNAARMDRPADEVATLARQGH